jgi:hypothetical protein
MPDPNILALLIHITAIYSHKKVYFQENRQFVSQNWQRVVTPVVAE